MSVQRFDSYGYMPSPEGKNMRYDDHARIVAEAAAQAREAAYREMTDERHSWPGPRGFDYDKGYEQGKRESEQAHAAALAAVPDFSPQRDDESDHEYLSRSIGRCAVTFDPKRGQNAAAPRTLTADDPGYHSQRCLHCDHIRATHTLTAHGCIGHALPGRPGADCPCAEFIHDGEDQQAEPEWDKPYEEQSDAVKAGLAKIAQAALHDGEATP